MTRSPEQSEGRFSPREAEKKGYDPTVVAFFKERDSELLSYMWDSSSAFYQGILKNTIADDRLVSGAFSTGGRVDRAAKLMQQFRTAQTRS